MRSQVFSNITLKILAVYIMAEGILQLPSVITVMQFTEYPSNDNITLLPFLLIAVITPLLLGIVLWSSSGKITKMILRGVPKAEKLNFDASELQSVAIATVGLILIVHSLPQLFSITIQLFGYMDTVDDKKIFNINYLALFIAVIVKLILGVSLVLGTRGWINLIRKIKYFGVK